MGREGKKGGRARGSSWNSITTIRKRELRKKLKQETEITKTRGKLRLRLSWPGEEEDSR